MMYAVWVGEAIGKLNAAKMRTLIKPGTYSDGSSLYLQVRGAEQHAWLYRCKLYGKPHPMALGTVAVVVAGRRPRRRCLGLQAGQAGD